MCTIKVKPGNKITVEEGKIQSASEAAHCTPRQVLEGTPRAYEAARLALDLSRPENDRAAEGTVGPSRIWSRDVISRAA